MWHVLALTEDVVTATLTDLDAVAEQIVPRQNGHFFPQIDVNLYAAICYGTDLQRVRLSTPRLRQISNVFLRPLQPSLVGANDSNVCQFFDRPLYLRRQEEIVVEALHDAGVNQQITVGLFVAPSPSPGASGLIDVPSGEKYRIRATSTTAVTANAWSDLTYTLDQQLPVGTYSVCGVEHSSANGQLFRCVFDQQYWRPGAPSLSDVNQRLPYPWLEGLLGEWGRFSTYSTPRIEVLANAADAVHEVYFDLVQVSREPMRVAPGGI